MIEDKIQETIKPIISIYSKIELEIIEKIAKHFNLNEEFINSDYWYFEKLKEMGGLNNETMKLLEKYTGRTKQELLKAMQDIGVEAIPTEQLNLATQKGTLLDPQAILNSTNIQNMIKYSYNEIEKSFLQLNKTIEEKTRKIYKDILTQTYAKTLAGTHSYQEAILESLDELGNKGISVLTYQDKNGLKKNYDVVGTVRRDLLCATRGLAGKVNEEVIKESGHHIVRVSHHFGARTGDGEENFTNHAWWQEKQFFCWNHDGKATEEEKKLPDFMEHCNYGHVQGIVGINCKHFFTVWYGSLDKGKLDFTYKENEEQYEKSQQQRYLENGIRKWKRKQVIAKNAQDEEGYKKASSKAREWQDRLRTFTEENDLRRDYTREHIKDYKVSTKLNKNDKMSTSKNNEVREVQYIDITNQYKEKKEYELTKQNYYLDNDGSKYMVDGKHVVLEPSEKEIEVAQLLGDIFGGQVNIIPRINYPKKIKTPDYIINGEKYDLKSLNENNKNTIYNAIHKQKKQSNNFIIDISKNGMTESEATKQITSLYYSKHTQWVKQVLLIRDNKLLKIYQHK